MNDIHEPTAKSASFHSNLQFPACPFAPGLEKCTHKINSVHSFSPVGFASGGAVRMFDHMFNSSSGSKLLILVLAMIVVLAVFEGVVGYHDRKVCENAGGIHTSIGCVDRTVFKMR
jgi:hypothetical protein